MLAERYAPASLAAVFTPQKRYAVWRRLWLSLARNQRRLGLDVVSEEALEQMEAALDRVDFTAVESYERRLRHDVMAHVHAFADVAPAARAVIHLGATSYFVVDNTDLVLLREALSILVRHIAHLVATLAAFAGREAETVVLGYTHLQPAQPTTAGKRACLWLWDFCRGLETMDELRKGMPFRSIKGAVGTQASFLVLFGGDREKVERLEKAVAADFGFDEVFPVTGQVYPRGFDAELADAVGRLAAAAHRFCQDVRLLCGLGDYSLAKTPEAVGSSAMPHKINPVVPERVCGLARYVMSLAETARQTAAHNWLERSLDDSAARRIYLERLMLGAGALVRFCCDVASRLRVGARARARLRERLPELAAEGVLMEAVLRGADRQEAHEALREAAALLREHGDLEEYAGRIEADERLKGVRLIDWLDERRLVGLAAHQTKSFIKNRVGPLLARFEPLAPEAAEV